MKTIDQNFADWESSAFGYGYGSGEEHTLPALKMFFSLISSEGRYDYRDLEKAMNPAVVWLLINILCREDMIEYGTSPRFGWLTKEGEELWEYLRQRTNGQLYDAVGQTDEYVHCYKDHCNCAKGDCRRTNPFWKHI